MSYIPNGSFLYNTEDKRLYKVTNMLIERETDDGVEILTRNPNEWTPSNAPISDYTFNLVAKVYPYGRAATLLAPVEHENVMNFATELTTKLIIDKFNANFKNFGIEFSHTGKTTQPKNYLDRVYLIVSKNDGSEELDTVGAWAIFEAENGTDVMFEKAKNGLSMLGFI